MKIQKIQKYGENIEKIPENTPPSGIFGVRVNPELTGLVS